MYTSNGDEDAPPSAKRTRYSPSAPSGIADEDDPAQPNSAQALTLEPSFLNAEPLDEFIREVADWIHKLSVGKEHIEIEGKLGMLVDVETDQRLNLPIRTEASES